MAIFVPRFVRQLRDVLLTAPADGEVLTYDSADEKWKNEAGGGGGGPPTGAAGGVLGGTYPNPAFAVDMATQAELDAHLNDAIDAHDATAVSFAPAGTIAAITVQAAIEEVAVESAGGAPDTADYLVGTTQGGLSAEIVVGATPGGELGGTWAAPTVDATHSGSSHAATQSAAEATAAAALAAHLAADVIDGDAAGGVLAGTFPNPGFAADMATQAELDAHITDATDAHDASAISILDAAADFTATEVEGALAELQTADEADEAALAAHLADATDAHDASAVSVVPFGTIAATQVQAVLEEIVAEAVTDLGPAVILAPASSARNVIQPTGAAVIPLTVKAAASQSADLLLLQNSSAATLSHVDSAGRLRVPVGSLAEAGIGFLADPNTGIFSPAADQLSVVAGGVEVVRVMSSGRVGIGLGGGTPNVPLDIGIGGINAPTYMIGYGNLFTANSGWMQYLQAAQTAIMLSGVPIYVTKNLQLAPTNAQVVSTLLYLDLVGAASAAWTGLKIRGAASQSESLQEWHTSADAILGRVNKDGYFMTRKIAAPADADVATSELAFWFDNTNGAGKAMFKGKTADGTVVTGSVALA